MLGGHRPIATCLPRVSLLAFPASEADRSSSSLFPCPLPARFCAASTSANGNALPAPDDAQSEPVHERGVDDEDVELQKKHRLQEQDDEHEEDDEDGEDDEDDENDEDDEYDEADAAKDDDELRVVTWRFLAGGSSHELRRAPLCRFDIVSGMVMFDQGRMIEHQHYAENYSFIKR